MRRIVSKSLSYYKKLYGENTNSLFRKDTLSDDLIKGTIGLLSHSFLNKLYG